MYFRFIEEIRTEQNCGCSVRIVQTDVIGREQHQPRKIVVPTMDLLRLEVRQHFLHFGTGETSGRHECNGELSSSWYDRFRNLEKRASTIELANETDLQMLLQDAGSRLPDQRVFGLFRRSGRRERQVFHGLQGERIERRRERHEQS